MFSYEALLNPFISFFFSVYWGPVTLIFAAYPCKTPAYLKPVSLRNLNAFHLACYGKIIKKSIPNNESASLTVHDPGSRNCAVFVLYTVSIVPSLTSRV